MHGSVGVSCMHKGRSLEVCSSVALNKEKQLNIEVRPTRQAPMSLEDRVKCAILNIDKAFQARSPELDSTISITKAEYLNQQRLLLQNLLESSAW